MDHGERLVAAATEVARFRRELSQDPTTRSWVHALKQWQARRLARTHRDLLSDPRHAAAARFFLDDLYGAKDFSQRDAELMRLVPMMVRMLPGSALATIADAIEMDALSERLDLGVARELRCVDPEQIDAAGYADAYRRTGSRADREHQLTLIGRVGRSLDRLVRHPLIGRLLKVMAGPAHLAGLSQMHEFLVRGFESFRSIGGAAAFLESIERRENEILEELYSGRASGWDDARERIRA